MKPLSLIWVILSINYYPTHFLFFLWIARQRLFFFHLIFNETIFEGRIKPMYNLIIPLHYSFRERETIIEETILEQTAPRSRIYSTATHFLLWIMQDKGTLVITSEGIKYFSTKGLHSFPETCFVSSSRWVV